MESAFRACDYAKVLVLYQKLSDVSHRSFKLALESAYRIREFDTVQRVYNHWVQSKQHIESPLIWNRLISSYLQTNQLEVAVDVFEKFDQAKTFSSYTALILAFCKRSDLSSAQTYFEEFLSAGYRPDCRIFSWIICGLCQNNDHGNALDQLCRMLYEFHLQPEPCVIESILRVSCSSMETGICLRLVETLSNFKIEMNFEQVLCVIEKLSRLGRFDLAKTLALSVDISSKNFKELMFHLAELQEIECTIALLMELKDSCKSWRTNEYEALFETMIRDCSPRQAEEEVLSYFRSVSKTLPTGRMFRSIVKKYEEMGMARDAERFLESTSRETLDRVSGLLQSSSQQTENEDTKELHVKGFDESQKHGHVLENIEELCLTPVSPNELLDPVDLPLSPPASLRKLLFTPQGSPTPRSLLYLPRSPNLLQVASPLRANLAITNEDLFWNLQSSPVDPLLELLRDIGSTSMPTHHAASLLGSPRSDDLLFSVHVPLDLPSIGMENSSISSAVPSIPVVDNLTRSPYLLLDRSPWEVVLPHSPLYLASSLQPSSSDELLSLTALNCNVISSARQQPGVDLCSNSALRRSASESEFREFAISSTATDGKELLDVEKELLRVMEDASLLSSTWSWKVTGAVPQDLRKAVQRILTRDSQRKFILKPPANNGAVFVLKVKR
eukprot:TRINITY_DN969_c0_g1_i1.p1 TRINITY_DN969_c0_g1~~TRINITY_DN969_c0_g1_i1.p1  ORF type:complete len:672 (-),score=129.51 TRINITY_DN969_c0_g1_i1:41-2056(-)